MLKNVCPRCKGPLDQPSSPSNALSRTDSKTEICSVCGQEEAFEAQSSHGVTSQAEWPLRRSRTEPTRDKSGSADSGVHPGWVAGGATATVLIVNAGLLVSSGLLAALWAGFIRLGKLPSGPEVDLGRAVAVVGLGPVFTLLPRIRAGFVILSGILLALTLLRYRRLERRTRQFRIAVELSCLAISLVLHLLWT